ncbi:MAG: hypothetical protein ACLQOZ_06110 [Acidimicrobiales bacterium]|jgi:hypothetical protein
MLRTRTIEATRPGAMGMSWSFSAIAHTRPSAWSAWCASSAAGVGSAEGLTSQKSNGASRLT